MSDLDDEIRNALQTDQENVLKDDDDLEAYFESLKYMFRGQTKWFTLIHLLAMVVLISLMVTSAIQFFKAEDMRSMIGWATGFAVCIILEGLVELYFMLQIDKHSLRWEIKQLQLQIAAGTRSAEAE
jgi:hypothetical protein